MKRILLFATSLALLTQAGSSTRAQTPDALRFFKNYFITGDYVVGGVGLRGQGVNGIATGSIAIQGVPQKRGCARGLPVLAGGHEGRRGRMPAASARRFAVIR